jgi:hypothetical protein
LSQINQEDWRVSPDVMEVIIQKLN